MKANDILVYLRTDISDTGVGIQGKTSLQMLTVEMCINILLYAEGGLSEASPPLIQIPLHQQKTWILAEFLLSPPVCK